MFDTKYVLVGSSLAVMLVCLFAFQNCAQSLPPVDESSTKATPLPVPVDPFVINPGPTPGPGAGSQVISPDASVYRLRSPDADYLYTGSTDEVASAKAIGYTSEGIHFKVFSANSTGGRIKIFRCYSKTLYHYLSPDPNCEGIGAEGALGFAEPNATAGAPLRLYRCWNSQLSRHLQTINPVAECTTETGFAIESQINLGFVSL